MRISQVCQFLEAKLPQFSDNFSTSAISASVSYTGGVVTVTAISHGLSADDPFTLSGFSPVEISSEIINYSHTVATVVDPDNFTFTIEQGNTENLGGGKLHKSVRAYASIDTANAIKAYTQTQLLTAVVIDLGSFASKDRGTGSDANFQQTTITDFKMTMINQFGVLIFFPLKNDTIGKVNADTARFMQAVLMRSLSGVRLDTDWGDNKSQGITFTSSNREQVTNATLVQNYTFEVVEIIYGEDVNIDTFDFDATFGDIQVEPVFSTES
jgi:hypothetical protein